MESYIKTAYTEIWIQDGIIHTTHISNLNVTLEIAKECVSERLKICNGKVYPLFFDTTNIKSVDDEAKKYLSSEEAIKYLSAGAFLVKSQFQRTMATAFILINRPPVPARFFCDYHKAIAWLQAYKNIN